MSCEYCGGKLDPEADDCPECEAERAASLAEYLRRGGYHPNLKPAGPWRSRENLTREDVAR